VLYYIHKNGTQKRTTNQEISKMTHGERIQMYRDMSSDELRKAIAEYSKRAQRAQLFWTRTVNEALARRAQAELDSRN
jgi:histidinol-phosphate/aromatic aminotransferase/cobyric acid decarboxylase-like protein